MKKFLKVSLIAFLVMFGLTACGDKKEDKKTEKTDLTPTAIIDKIYEGVPEDKLPGLGTVELDKDNFEYYLGTKDVDFKSGVASEPMMGSIAWSVVAVELNDGADVDKTVKAIKDNAPTAKWICVDAEELFVGNKGNIVVLIMMDEEYSDVFKTVEKNFNEMK